MPRRINHSPFLLVKACEIGYRYTLFYNEFSNLNPNITSHFF